VNFVTYSEGAAQPQVGVIADGRVYPLQSFENMLRVIVDEEAALKAAEQAVQKGNGVSVGEVRLLAPIARPPRIFCIGLNYASHAAESQMKVQAVPTVFMKLASSVVGPGDDIILPRNSTQPDYEAELAVVISKPGYRIPAEEWEQHVFGYTILNDVSARDIQLATSQWTLGKSFPTFCPIGPSIASKEDIRDPHTLDIKLSIAGEVLQSSNTRDLIFRIPQLIEYISSLTPLESGDIISTGTPEGVGLGRNPQRWLRDGEEIVITIERIGELRNGTRADA
jgi:2-keto-4-pentenoate hydratase/2-oxohepta-3-ene-1,7-dioic acid hydratase in catechol pathway